MTKQQEKAPHGPQTEVTWEGGEGRQPYANQGTQPQQGPAAAAEAEGGNRGAHSGVQQRQDEDVKRGA